MAILGSPRLNQQRYCVSQMRMRMKPLYNYKYHCSLLILIENFILILFTQEYRRCTQCWMTKRESATRQVGTITCFIIPPMQYTRSTVSGQINDTSGLIDHVRLSEGATRSFIKDLQMSDTTMYYDAVAMTVYIQSLCHDGGLPAA